MGKSLSRQQKITVSAVLAVSGAPLAEVTCRTSDTVAMLSRAVAVKLEDLCEYVLALGDRVLDARVTLGQAGVEQGAVVSCVRGGGKFVEVPTLSALWKSNERHTRYPRTLALRGVFYATPECREEDEVEFVSVVFGGGFVRYFVNREGLPEDTQPHNYVRVFVRQTQSFEVVDVLVGAARFGGIVVQPWPRLACV
mmetsp:Transcript_46306/g.106905  ORF Transcript_46306/g.106905 Transcript_46306/m.106905 type:complete len:196 (+) Transcript_46306:96-683(+)